MSTNSKHIILGAGGAIGKVLTEKLLAHGASVRLVSRSGRAMEGTEAVAADITDASSTLSAVENGSIVYLTAGLPYRISIWREQWPKIMQNTISACSEKSAKLIFFDNVYVYGRVDGAMTEQSPYNPCSKKGELRVQIAEHLMAEVGKGNLKAMIVRAADFYGPYADSGSLPYLFVFKRLAAGKKAQSLVSIDKKHSYTYTGDCGKALYLLSETDDAFNQVWHLPTASPAPTGREFIKIAADRLGGKPGVSILGPWAVKLAGLFDKQVGEVYEMLYQNKYDYVFDSTKFQKRFDFNPTAYDKGIADTIEHFRTRGGLSAS
jgi:nucleoside-diphosphate-sugar epimerase